MLPSGLPTCTSKMIGTVSWDIFLSSDGRWFLSEDDERRDGLLSNLLECGGGFSVFIIYSGKHRKRQAVW